VLAPSRCFTHSSSLLSLLGLFNSSYLRRDPLGHLEPGSLGDSLWQLEQFIYDLLDDRPGRAWPPFLLGYDQGAVMALTLALVIPDYLASVVAIRGYLPDLQSWPIEALEMDNLPVLLMCDPEDTGFPGSFTDEAARQLSAHGAQVSVQEVPGAHALGRGVGHVLQSWLRSHGALDGKAQR